MTNLKLKVPYVSVWDGGTEIESMAMVDCKTGEVTDIEPASISVLDICERKYIVMNDTICDVYEDEYGYDYWADLNGVYEN